MALWTTFVGLSWKLIISEGHLQMLMLQSICLLKTVSGTLDKLLLHIAYITSTYTGVLIILVLVPPPKKTIMLILGFITMVYVINVAKQLPPSKTCGTNGTTNGQKCKKFKISLETWKEYYIQEYYRVDITWGNTCIWNKFWCLKKSLSNSYNNIILCGKLRNQNWLIYG